MCTSSQFYRALPIPSAVLPLPGEWQEETWNLERPGTSPGETSPPSTAAFQQRFSWPCCSEQGVVTQPGCRTPAQRNNHHLSSGGNESSSAVRVAHVSPRGGGCPCSLSRSFCAGLQLWCFTGPSAAGSWLESQQSPVSALHQLGKHRCSGSQSPALR